MATDITQKRDKTSHLPVGQAGECTDVHPDSDCVNSSNSPPTPTVKRKVVDEKNEPDVKPGEMLEDYKFTQH